jgi:hypothetical protein
MLLMSAMQIGLLLKQMEAEGYCEIERDSVGNQL